MSLPYSAAESLADCMAHDGHHRGQIAQIARMLGRPLDQATMSGVRARRTSSSPRGARAVVRQRPELGSRAGGIRT